MEVASVLGLFRSEIFSRFYAIRDSVCVAETETTWEGIEGPISTGS